MKEYKTVENMMADHHTSIKQFLHFGKTALREGLGLGWLRHIERLLSSYLIFCFIKNLHR